MNSNSSGLHQSSLETVPQSATIARRFAATLGCKASHVTMMMMALALTICLATGTDYSSFRPDQVARQLAGGALQGTKASLEGLDEARPHPSQPRASRRAERAQIQPGRQT
mmetsp:Transcript_11418/g.20061  ORF Transcript_11418/g.20061 Transcript_11418/m.20061 type:complete len:111 (-) Transcript_11418:8-340(-)